MLRVAALEVGHPRALLILMEAHDAPPHALSNLTNPARAR